MSDNSEAFEENKSEMLEDEEMPTFISVSSKEISLPYADANVELLAIDNSANPLLRVNETADDDYEGQSRSPTTEEREEEDNEDNEEGSILVLSSGEEADDADPSSRSYDEDVDEEEDVDDEDDEDIDDMDEIEGEEEEIGIAEDGQLLGDFSDEEIEKEDVMSDDMALRSDHKPMEVINDQKRSQSLQDLSEYGMPSRRKSFVTGGSKYNRVQSKVRRYIQDLKEQRRRSAEIRLKAIEDARKQEKLDSKAQKEEEAGEICQQSARGRRSIKDYAEQALKDLEMREEASRPDEEEGVASRQETEKCVVRTKNNLQNESNLKTENEEDHPNDFRCEFKTASQIYRSTKKVNMNGEIPKEALKNMKIPKEITVNYTLNGQTQGENILDVRSIGYDEYMKGSSNTNTEKNVQAVETKKKQHCDEEMQSPKPKLEITNIRSEAHPDLESKVSQSTEETPMEIAEREEDSNTIIEPEQNDKTNKEALAELAMIQTQLNQKTNQCKEFREAYEKTLTENFKLKQELEDLKKTISKLSVKKATPELVAVAIQTDPPPPPPAFSPPVETTAVSAADNYPNPKLSTSSMGSAVSTNEHWTESAGSLPMSNGSMRPMPNLTPLSNAEDSFIGVASTPPRTPRQPSHAFQTSSKIIKMLSSITQRKSKADGAFNGEEALSNIFGKTASSSGVSSYHSPLNQRGSNKRKASEMPENANFLQPPKIPHTSGGSHRSHRRTKSEFKFPGDYAKLNHQTFTPQSSDTNRNMENLEDSRPEDDPRDDLDSGVKCFTFREDENVLERSFLIQAEDEEKVQERAKDAERSTIGVVRECGPYLLGNVEVRMTEVNGTINIWGKEVSQETVTEDEPEVEADIEDELNEREACSCWHKTPNARNNNTGPICSTNKKVKIPSLRLNDSGFLKNYHSPLTSSVDNFKDRHQHVRSSEIDSHCRNCDPHSNPRLVNKSRRFSNFGEEESPVNISSNNCGCNWDNENCDFTSYGRVSRHCHEDNIPNIRGTGRCSRLDSAKDNRQLKTEENLNRNKSSRFNNNYEDDNVTCRHGVGKNNIPENDDDDDEVFRRPSTSRVNDTCFRNESCRSHSPSLNNRSNDPLLLSHHPHEPPEVRRRRSSGKRVRGILMDFFRGCGDCRVTNGPDNKVSPSTSVPQIRIRSGTPPPTLSNQTQQRTASYGSTNERCVHTERCATCARRIQRSVAAEIKSQLEIFGAEVERLHSRSEAVLGMLSTLQSGDTN